jgi:hypothetical protein
LGVTKLVAYFEIGHQFQPISKRATKEGKEDNHHSSFCFQIDLEAGILYWEHYNITGVLQNA